MKQLAMYINGRFENDFNGEWRDVLNPSTEETIAREPKGGKADVDRAVAAARAAQPAWERLPAVERAVMKAKSSKATARAKIFYCSNVRWASWQASCRGTSPSS